MFAIIIAIVAIVLFVIIVVATMSHGGAAIFQAKDTADAAGIINQSAQINGALVSYKAFNGVTPTGSSDDIKDALVNGQYLSSFPNSSSWEFINDFAVAKDLTDEQCVAVNQRLNIPGDTVPSCADVTDGSKAVCCSE